MDDRESQTQKTAHPEKHLHPGKPKAAEPELAKFLMADPMYALGVFRAPYSAAEVTRQPLLSSPLPDSKPEYREGAATSPVSPSQWSARLAPLPAVPAARSIDQQEPFSHKTSLWPPLGVYITFKFP